MAFDANDPADQKVLQDAIAKAMEGVEAKKTQLLGETKEEREKRRNTEAELEKLKSSIDGVDLDKYKTLIANEEAEEQRKAEEKGEFEKLTVAMREKHLADMEKERQEAGRYKDLAFRGSASSEISNALIAEKGSPELLDAVVRGRTQVIEENGMLKTIGLNEDGSPMMTEDGKHGTPLDVVKHLKTIPAYQRAFDAHQMGGSGSRSSVAGYTGANPFKAETRNLTEQMKILREQPALAQTLKAEAGL